nr:MAG TPA: hypothetical protein [Caudoviricetes sp.]
MSVRHIPGKLIQQITRFLYQHLLIKRNQSSTSTPK